MRESVQRSVGNIYSSFRLGPSLSLFPSPFRLRHSPLRSKPLELRKIDKSSAAEQFVYSTARLRANELERITYSRGLSPPSPCHPPAHPRRSPPLHPTPPSRSVLPLFLAPFYSDDRPSVCACDRGHWHPHARPPTSRAYIFSSRRAILSAQFPTFNRFLCRQTRLFAPSRTLTIRPRLSIIRSRVPPRRVSILTTTVAFARSLLPPRSRADSQNQPLTRLPGTHLLARISLRSANLAHRVVTNRERVEIIPSRV